MAHGSKSRSSEVYNNIKFLKVNDRCLVIETRDRKLNHDVPSNNACSFLVSNSVAASIQ